MTAVDTGLRLNLGCNDRRFPGFINVDIVPPADQIVNLAAFRYFFRGESTDFSLTRIVGTLASLFKRLCTDGIPGDWIEKRYDPWPWGDSTVIEALAFDLFEHLPNKRHAINELWRILRPGGIARIGVPTAPGVGPWCDLTHRSVWTAGDFEYYEKGNYARERFRPDAEYYAVKADFRIVSHKWSNYRNKFGEEVKKFDIVLEALK